MDEKEMERDVELIQQNVRGALLHFDEHVVNVVEIIAQNKIMDVIELMNGCSCDKCIDDTLAMSLNSLPKKYITVDPDNREEKLKKCTEQFEPEVISALMKACLLVKLRPRH